MTADMYFYEPSAGHGLKHNPFNAIIAPRPIGWIASRSAEGGLNLAPYSFFNAFNYTPPIIGFAATGRKDTLNNVEANGEFVWNLVTRALAERMNLTSASVGPEVDEFALAGVTPAPSRLISVPRVAESPVAFECRVTQIIQLTTLAGESISTWLTLGEVVAVHIDKALIVDGLYDTAAAHPIVRAGRRSDYFEITPQAYFSLPRPD